MKKIYIVLLISILIGIISVIWWKSGLLPVDPNNKTPKIFTVKKGDGVREISKNLKENGLIRDQIVFFLYTRANGIDKRIQAGDFRLTPDMSASQIAENITHGILDIWVTIPEGLRAEEIAQILKNKIPSYQDLWSEELQKNEGYLFPDTYLIPKDATIEQILGQMKNNFQQKYATIKNNKTNSSLSDAQIIILASIVEKETKFEEDRYLAASVFINRLDIGMPLGSDPTVTYALGYDNLTKSWWKRELTVDDLEVNSPFNTRKNAELPPTPISNPGLPSIQAVLNPADTDYLYFYSDIKGHLHFAKTIEGHNANIEKYKN